MTLRVKGAAVALAVVGGVAVPAAQASAWDRGRVRTFAVLPAGASGPEGLEVDSHGRVYVSTFGFTATGPASGEGQLFVFDDHGRLLRQVSIAGSSPHLLGMRFQPGTGTLLVVDNGSSKVLAVDPQDGSSTVFLTLPSPLPHPAAGASLNDVTFDRAGNVYVSDSAAGIVWKTGPHGGTAAVWVDSPLLTTTGVPPFGANGIRFDRRETAMFVANTGNDTVVRVPVSGGVAGTPAVFTNSINGADGLLIDDHDNLWVVANQADEIVVVDPTGKAIAKLGDFGGAIDDGSPVGLLFPASLRFLGDELVVTNLSLDLRLFNPAFESVDSEWCAQVTRYTVSTLRVRARAVGGRED
jgi:sugar lactone lactonase YvrE